VNYLSQTYEGKRHDKKIADEENPTYPEDIGVYQDTGFQGYAPDGVKTFQPQKKPKGKELTPEQKEYNRRVSKNARPESIFSARDLGLLAILVPQYLGQLIGFSA